MSDSTFKIPIGVSACLLGEQVRYNGGHKKQPYIVNTLEKFFAFHAFCPEVSIGLGIPREPIRIVMSGPETDPEFRVVGTNSPDLDVTTDLTACAQHQQHWVKNLCGYIFKKDSPSCGMERVKAYRKTQPIRQGIGLYAKVIMENNPLMPCEEEGRLNDLRLRENFIERVYVFHRWRKAEDEGLTPKALIDFHSRHKFIVMSHSQKGYRELGQMLASIPKHDFDHFKGNYISRLMKILKKPASRKNHINVLQHLQGYLKSSLDGEDKREMVKAIDDCRQNNAPLTIPRTLLRHYFRKYPDPYILQSYYLAPYPDELNF